MLHVRFVRLWVLLFFVWFLLSGMADAMHLGFGLFSSFVIAMVARKFLRNYPCFPWMRMAAFLPWHLYQVFVSNLRVAKLALTVPASQIKPIFLVSQSSLKGEQALAVLGICTTLTPGTLTIDIDEEGSLVHALDRASADDIKEKTMERRIAHVFGGAGI